MSNPESRQERRSVEREQAKVFDAVVKELKEALDHGQPRPFKAVVLDAITYLASIEHPNKLVAATVISGAVDCESRGEEESARLLLYAAGAIVNPAITTFALTALKNYKAPPIIVSPPTID